MPRIRLSDRNIETSPLTRYHMPSGFREGLHGLGVATQAQLEAARQKKRNADDWQRVIATGLDAAARIKGAVERRAEQDANEVATQWEATMLAGLNGSTAEDGSHRPGIAQKTWQDYEQSGGKESPITDLAEIEKTFQSSDAYKNMTGMARDRFNRKVAVRRAQYQRAVNEMYDRNRADRTAYFDKMADKVGEDKIATTIFSDDATFEGTAREETFRKMGRKFRALMANPEVIDEPGATPDDIKWKDPRADLYFKGAMISDLRNLAMGRCAKMAENAAQGDVKWVGGKLVTNDAQLKAAEAYAAKLATPTKLADGTVIPARISPAEAQAIGFKCVQARVLLDSRIQNEISGKAANAIAQGNLKELEATEVQLLSAAKDFEKGSKNQTTALVAANKVETAADLEAVRIVKNDLLSGHAVTMSDGKTPIYDPGSRLAKAYTVAVAEAAKDRAKSAAALDDNIRYQELELDYAIESGMASKDDISKKKREIVDRVDALSAGRLMKPEDVATFRKRWADRNAVDESAAAVDFDRAFGLSLEDFTDAKGAIPTDVSNANYKKTIRSGQKAMFPGTDKNVSLGEYLKMRASFLERLRALPANADRRQETAKLLDEFKGGWYARQTEANIDALARTMNEIHLGIESEVEAERLKAAAEEEKRNMPVVDRRHPANADPQQDPLEFYRQANPLDPTIKYR